MIFVFPDSLSQT